VVWGGGSCRCFNVSRTAGSHVLKSCFGTVIRKKCKVSATELEPVGRQGRFSERELTFTFAICYRPSVCRLSVTLVRPTEAVQIFGNICTALDTLAIN